MNGKSVAGVLLAIALLLSILPGAGCSPKLTVTFAELTSNPAKYQGRIVIVEGYIFFGFEISALAGGLVPASQPGNLRPSQPLIWVKSSLSTAIQSKLQRQQNTPSGYDEYYGYVRLEGRFEYGGPYGHLDAYQYQLTYTEVQVLPWKQMRSPAAT